MINLIAIKSSLSDPPFNFGLQSKKGLNIVYILNGTDCIFLKCVLFLKNNLPHVSVSSVQTVVSDDEAIMLMLQLAIGEFRRECAILTTRFWAPERICAT